MLTNFRKQAATKNLKLNMLFFTYLKNPKFGFASPAEKLPTLEGKPQEIQKGGDVNAIQPWVEIENRIAKLRGELILSDHGKIENYVLGVVKGYFRTTYKDGLTLNSNLEDHGLDSLDSIELGMILEDELGYIIEAETLPQFTKVKHFVNYIKQMEAYKKEYILLPQVKAQENEETWNDWIPYGEKLKSKLFSMTESKTKKEAKKEKKAKH
jgi:acyl carrier protein